MKTFVYTFLSSNAQGTFCVSRALGDALAGYVRSRSLECQMEYKCVDCGVKGKKMWRRGGSFHPETRCACCASAYEGIPCVRHELRPDGSRFDAFWEDYTFTIENHVPAVLVEGTEDQFYGVCDLFEDFDEECWQIAQEMGLDYKSEPRAEYIAWRALPN